MKRTFLSVYAAVTLLTHVVEARADDVPPGLPPDVRWRGDNTLFFFQNSGDTTGFWRSFDAALSLWQPGNFRFQMTGDASNNSQCHVRPPGVRIVNIAGFAQQACNADFGANVLAVTTTRWDPVTHELLAADMAFNTGYIWNIYHGSEGSRPDFQRVAVHELGHAAGLNHIYDTSSIMYPIIGNVEVPSPSDQNAMRTKYAVPLPPSPPGPFNCFSGIPYSPTVDYGTLVTTTYFLEGCLDANRPQTVFYFAFAEPHTVELSVGADDAALNVELDNGPRVLWASTDNSKSKVTTLTFQKGSYSLRVWRDSTGSKYSVAWTFQ